MIVICIDTWTKNEWNFSREDEIIVENMLLIQSFWCIE